jgi:hypothetical protein
MSTGINLVPKKTREELKRESKMYTLEIISALLIIIVEVASFLVVGATNSAQKHENYAKVAYVKDQKVLHSFTKTISVLNNINQRFSTLTSINKQFSNPVTVINRFKAFVPPNITLYNYIYTYQGSILFNAKASSVLHVAHLIHNLSSHNSSNKYFSNTQIRSVSITYNNNGTKTATFKLVTLYHNGSKT